MGKREDIATALTSLGFSSEGSVFYGTWKGYAVGIAYNSSQLNYWVELAARVDKKDNLTLIRSLRKAIRGRGLKRFQGAIYRKDGIIFTLNPDSKAPYTEQFSTYLDAFAEELHLAGVQPSDVCSVCGQAGADSLWLTSTSYQPVHRRCAQENAAQLHAAVEDNADNGNYAAGILGAIIGALVGLIPNVLIGVYTDTMYAVLFTLVPLAAIWGYRKLRGPNNRAAIVIVIILSLLSVFLFEVALVVASLIRDYLIPFGPAVSLTFGYLLTGEGFVTMLQDCLMALLFMGIGIAFSWRSLSRTNDAQIRSLDASLNTIQPNPSARQYQDF